MQLYIPEISDQLTLSKDWKFDLHAESRNKALGAFFGLNLEYLGAPRYDHVWVSQNDIAPMRAPDYVIPYPDRNDPKFKTSASLFSPWESFGGGQRVDVNKLNQANKEAEDNCVEYQLWLKDNEAYQKKVAKYASNNKSVEVTIPKGTLLQVDRIYIRKGASDYSSITFFAKNIGEVIIPASRWSRSTKPVKKKALRFWAKLSDCNNIEFK